MSRTKIKTPKRESVPVMFQIDPKLDELVRKAINKNPGVKLWEWWTDAAKEKLGIK